VDLSSNVTEEFLQKFNLESDGSILGGQEHQNLLEEILQQQFPISYSAGGSGQNTMRVAQSLLQPGETTYIGSIGRDYFGTLLSQITQKDGLLPIYMIHPTLPTGTCTVLITNNGNHRSLIANLAAAQHYSLEHALSLPVTQKLQSSRIVYMTGYFLQAAFDTVTYVLNFSQRNGKMTCFNLSAPFVCEEHNEKILQVLPSIDFIFGNVTEALALAKVNHFGTQQIEEIIQKLANLEKTVSGKRERIVVITNGAMPTKIAISGNKENIEVPVDPVLEEEIVDTTGAGDAFVGGFFECFSKRKITH